MKRLYMILPALVLVFLNGCGDEEIKSMWNDSSIIINGNQADWLGKLKYFPDQKAGVGIANDNENLYLCLATSDTGRMFQLFVTGFTVWFNPENGGEKIGIQYPLRLGETGGIMPRWNRQEGGRPDFKVRLDQFKVVQTEFRIVNADNFPLTSYNLKNDLGISIDVDYQMGLLVYEMKVPLKGNLVGNHVLNLLSGDHFNIGFESGEFNGSGFGRRGEGSGFRMGNPPEGEMGGRGRMPGGGMGRGRRPILEKIDFEVSVILAANK